MTLMLGHGQLWKPLNIVEIVGLFLLFHKGVG
jgi:hypothetical protein